MHIFYFFNQRCIFTAENVKQMKLLNIVVIFVQLHEQLWTVEHTVASKHREPLNIYIINAHKCWLHVNIERKSWLQYTATRLSFWNCINIAKYIVEVENIKDIITNLIFTSFHSKWCSNYWIKTSCNITTILFVFNSSFHLW